MSVDQFLLSADTTDLNYPDIRPTLDLNFARTKTLDPRITFTRSSGGSYVGPDGLIKYAGVNEPRFDHDPATGESLGLLIEQSRSNLITLTTNTQNGLPITDFNYPINEFNETNTQLDIAPDGNLVRCKYDLTGTNGPFLNITSTASITAGVTYTMSMWVKGGSNYGASFAWVNQTTSEVPNTFISITPEWKRYIFSFTPKFNSTSWRLQIFFATQGNNKIISVWGAQLEQGPFATSYIPRPSGQTTRAADDVIITGKNFSEWYRQDEGTVFTISKYNGDSGTIQNIFEIYGTNSNRMGASFRTELAGNQIRAYDVNNFYPQVGFDFWTANTDPNIFYRTIFAVKSLDMAAVTNYPNFRPIQTGLRIVLPKNLLYIGRNISGQYLNGIISNLKYFPKRLPNEQLIALTR